MMNLLLFTTLVATLSLGFAAILVNDEKRLTQSLINRYQEIGKTGRPVAKDSDVWNVTFGLNLISITKFDFEAQAIEVIIWMMMEWKDAYLTWNKSEFDVDSVRMPTSAITMPDIVAYNADSPPEDLASQPLAVVSSDGLVLYVPPIKQCFTCPMSEDDDTISCSLKFGSWTYDGNHLNLTLRHSQADLSAYELNAHWKLVGAPASRHVQFYDCCPDEPYVDVTFNITVTKRDSSWWSKR